MAAKKLKVPIFKVVFALLLHFISLLLDIMIRIGKLSHSNDYGTLFTCKSKMAAMTVSGLQKLL